MELSLYFTRDLKIKEKSELTYAAFHIFVQYYTLYVKKIYST